MQDVFVKILDIFKKSMFKWYHHLMDPLSARLKTKREKAEKLLVFRLKSK